MGASKRSNYSNSSSRRSAGTEAARNLGVVLGLGGLSFFLGFFVLSRMVPDKRDASGLAPAAASTPRNAPAMPVQTSEPNPVRSETAQVASAPTRIRANQGPVLEQAEEPATQPSGSIERASKPADPDAANNAEPANTSDATGATPATRTTEPAGTSLETGGASSTTPRARRRARAATPEEASPAGEKTDTGSLSQEDQKPSRIDRDSSGDTASRPTRRAETGSASTPRVERSDSATDESSRTPKTATRTRYSVRGSAYSRREAAEREVRHIADLGLDATVVPVTTEDGTTVYRVQQGVYRNRSNAEKAKTKLSDAGVEAEIVRSREKE